LQLISNEVIFNRIFLLLLQYFEQCQVSLPVK